MQSGSETLSLANLLQANEIITQAKSKPRSNVTKCGALIAVCINDLYLNPSDVISYVHVHLLLPFSMS